jgi:hypothetical protein
MAAVLHDFLPKETGLGSLVGGIAILTQKYNHITKSAYLISYFIALLRSPHNYDEETTWNRSL